MPSARSPRRIAERDAAPGKATLREVARRAGVHVATASRAVNEETRSLVAPATAERVLIAARELDYHPNHLARSLKTQRSATIGVVVPDLTNPLFPPIVRGIEDRLGRSGYVALVASTDNDRERESRVLREMKARSVDGLILATAQRGQSGIVDTLSAQSPVVLLNRVLDEHRLPSVSVDDHAGVRAAVAHLIELGHRRIAYVAGPQRLSTGHLRYLAFLEGMAVAGIEADPALVAFADDFTEQEGYRCAAQLLARRRRFSAVLAGNDLLALGVLRLLDARDIACPAQCSLVGFNDMPLMDRVTPPLTTVHLPCYDAGFEAAALLLERIRHPGASPEVRLLPPELIVRGSTARPLARRRATPALRPAKEGVGGRHQ